MNQFEDWAREIISKLRPPTPPNKKKLSSIIQNAYQTLSGEAIEYNPQRNICDQIECERQLSDNLKENIEMGFISYGMEAMAFYKSIHYEEKPPFNGKWGIFIIDHSIKYIAEYLKDNFNNLSSKECYEKAFHLLYSHERFHFRFDAWSIEQEEKILEPLYENYRNQVYLPYHPDEQVREETLANLHALSSVARSGIYSFARELMLLQPGAYSNIENTGRNKLYDELVEQLLGKYINSGNDDLPEIKIDDIRKSDKWCPVYIVQGVDPSIFIDPSPSPYDIDEIRDGFIISYLDGKFDRNSGHEQYKIDNGQTVGCPNKHGNDRKAPRSSIRRICYRAGILTSTFKKERERTNVWKDNVPRDEVKPPLLLIGQGISTKKKKKKKKKRKRK